MSVKGMISFTSIDVTFYFFYFYKVVHLYHKIKGGDCNICYF
jgi:hypothetical protein